MHVVQAVLLIGFMEDEVDKFKGLMVSMDADMVKVRDHAGCSLPWELTEITAT